MNRKLKQTMKTHILYLLRAILVIVVSTVISLGLSAMGVGKESSLMVFLVGVLTVTAITRGYLYGAAAAVLSVLLFNFFFTPPLHTFVIYSTQDVILILFFLIASLISSSMTFKFQQQTLLAKRNEKMARLLYEITEGFLNVTGEENIIIHGSSYIYRHTDYHTRVVLMEGEKVYFNKEYNTALYNPPQGHEVITIKGLTSQIGTIEILSGGEPLPIEKELLIKTVVYQMALVLDREFIYNERENIRIAMESEHLKSTLLRGISHDLRTPLTGIMGASGYLLESFESIDPPSMKKLITDINEESFWLINLVQNILDMTRISEGKLAVRTNFEAVDDLINEALTHIPKLTQTGRLAVKMPKDIVLVKVDGKLIVQALVNLLDNAYRHTEETTPICLSAYATEHTVVFEIADEGSGIDPKIKDTLFDGFVTLGKNIADGQRGVGLGLAICKAIVTAHNGTIAAENKVDGGAVFRMILPIEEE